MQNKPLVSPRSLPQSTRDKTAILPLDYVHSVSNKYRPPPLLCTTPPHLTTQPSHQPPSPPTTQKRSSQPSDNSARGKTKKKPSLSHPLQGPFSEISEQEATIYISPGKTKFRKFFGLSICFFLGGGGGGVKRVQAGGLKGREVEDGAFGLRS